LNDPTLYGVYISLLSFDLDLMYRRVSDGVGKFSAEVHLPIPPISAGAFTLELPSIGVDVLTDGGFKLNLGFPTDMDFSRSFKLDMFPFGGAGGFYFAKYNTAGSDLLPDPHRYAMVWQAGIGLRVGYSARLTVGPFKAEASISIFSMLEGAAGFLPGRGLAHPDLALRGRFGITASLNCDLDLVLTALQFHLDIWVGVEIVLRIVNDALQPIDVAFEVGVRVNVRWVIARFKIFGKKIEIAVTLSFERTIRYSTTIGGGSRAAVARGASVRALRVVADDIWLRAVVDPDPTHPAPPVELFFLPDVAITRARSVALIAHLGIESAPTATSETDPVPNTPFDRLLREVIRWAARADALRAPRAPGGYTHDDIAAWRQHLVQTAAPSGGLTYDAIVEFLVRRTQLSVIARPDEARTVAMFPVLSQLGMAVTGAKSASARFNVSRYTEDDQAALERLLRGEGDASRTAGSGARALAELLVQEYFEGLVKLAVEDLLSVATAEPQPLDTLIDRLRTPRTADTFVLIASAISGQLLNGQHVPAPAVGGPNDPPGMSIYERTGQQLELFHDLPAAFPGPITVALTAVAPFASLQIDVQMEDATEFANLVAFDALMRDPAAAPTLATDPVQVDLQVVRRPRQFALVSEARFSAAADTSVFGFPAELQHVLGERLSPPNPAHLGLFTAVADDPAHADKPPEPGPAGTWLLRLPIEIRRPPEQQAARNVFEVVGVDDPTRRALETYLDHAGATNTVALYTVVEHPNGQPAELAEVDPARVLCVMTNTARQANPADAMRALRAPAPEQPVAAGPVQPEQFLRLLWSASIVRDGGFTLALPFADTEARLKWDRSDRTRLVALVELGATA
ncbi:MAG: large repetitive protein, partial [Actinomycetota bacterium]